ncbi:toll-like receptor 4 [Physella acuta]|uniref:toll-like receptor 4 n=1 Tax=Physella acuta TaxID=109671 RepID=UPI0027DDD840|nr:toll-like receptor 4 [Physella acuta]
MAYKPKCLKLPSNTKDLTLNADGMYTLKCDVFDNLNHLDFLELNLFAGFDTCEEYFQAQRFSLRKLVLGLNTIAELPANLFMNLQSLAYLVLYDNTLTRLQDEIQFRNYFNDQSNRRLHQSKTYRPKKGVYSKFNGLSNLEELDLSYNMIKDTKNNIFEGMKNLRVLGLSSSGGTGLCGKNLDDSWLRTDLAKLEDLRMNECNIDFISRTFYFPKNLKRLYLSQNLLTFFEAYTLRHLNMTYLDLSSNRLPGLSGEMWEELKRLKLVNPNFLVDLSDNKFQFSCTYVQSLHLLVTNTQLFENEDEMTFIKEDNTYLNYKEMVAQLPRLTKNCQIKEIFSYVLSVFFTHLLCLIVLAVFFYYRWKLRYLYFIGQRRLHIGGRFANYNPQVDIFITYDEGEPRIRQIVRNIILPFLREKNISYILGEVDFPGGDMVSHISGAITGSRKTLVLLSEDIFLDHYREYEMNLAIMREFNVRGQVIVPVFVERVDLNTYPPEVETYLRNQLYRCLVYRNNQTFWTLLLHAIRNDK